MTRIVFMGSPEFAVPILRELASQHSIIGVVTQPDRPAGRGKTLKPPAIKLAAIQLGFHVIQPENLRAPDALRQLDDWAPDVIVAAAFGQILRPNVLALPAHGCLNVHASLLPRWRGAAPIQAAIAAGDSETGVTIMKMDEGLDTGPILAKKRIPIETQDTGGSLSEKLSQLGAELLPQVLPSYLSGELTPVPQPEEGATHARLLKKQDGLLDFQETAEALARRVRAYDPWPGTYFDMEGTHLKVLRVHTRPGDARPGKRLVTEDLPAIGTSDGLLILDEVQPAGKKAMSGKAFLAGPRRWLG